MTAWVLGVVLAAGSGFSAAGAVTTGVDLRVSESGQSASAFVHGRLALERDFGRVWVSAEGAVLLTPTRATPLSDLGSHLTVGYRPEGFVKALSLEVTPFFLPMSRRASFDWLANWVSDAFQPFGPTLAVDVVTEVGTAWVAVHLKRPVLSMSSKLAPDTFAGVDVPLPAALRLELRGASVQYGNNPALESLGVVVPMFALAGVGRLSWTWNEEVGAMVDLFDYADDPTRFTRFATLERRRTPRAAQLFLEGGVVGQQLASTEVAGPRAQYGGWLDAQGRLRLGQLRVFTTLRLQSVEHAVAQLPGLVPATSFAPGLELAPALEARLGADLSLGASKLTPGVLVSVLRPASAEFADGSRVIPSTFARVPAGALISPVVTTRATLRWDPVPFLALVSELALSADPNRFVFRDSIEFQSRTAPLVFRAQLFAQGRF